jgi:hypothetical protein
MNPSVGSIRIRAGQKSRGPHVAARSSVEAARVASTVPFASGRSASPPLRASVLRRLSPSLDGRRFFISP